MPRDSNGNYTLPAGNPVVTGEVISTGWANPTMSDIGAELTNSLDRQGRGGMLAPFKFVDGTNSQPGITWTNEPTTGFYRAGGSDMRATVAGVSRMRWTATGSDLWDGSIWSPLVSNATLDTILLGKGYAAKAANETISGQWTFSTLQTFTNLVKVGNGAGTNGAKVTINSLTGQPADIQFLQDGISSWIIGSTSADGQLRISDSGNERLRISNSDGRVTVVGALSVGGNTTLSGTLGVTGHTSLASGQATSFNIVTPNAAQMVFTPGSGNQAQLIYPSGSTFVIRDELNERLSIAAGAVTIPGSLNVSGALSQNAVAVALSSTTITGVNSLTGGGSLAANRTLQLVNDVASPGNSFYYGTNSSGTKGWHALPADPTGYLPLTGGTMTGQIVLPGTGTGSQAATVTQATNAANSAVSTHVAASNPHTGYLLKTGGTLTGDLVLGGGSAAQFFNAANTVSKSLVIGGADELIVSGRGGVANWNSATLTSAQMYVGATGSAPASAAAGTIYFEY